MTKATDWTQLPAPVPADQLVTEQPASAPADPADPTFGRDPDHEFMLRTIG